VNEAMKFDADQSAPSRPKLSNTPAELFWSTTSRTTPTKLSLATTEPAPTSRARSSTVSTVRSPSETRPTRATTTTVEGKSASTP
jgi:hypothetical protein